MSMSKMPTVLHIMGSPCGVFDFDLSVFYGGLHLKGNYDKMNGYNYMLALVHPGGSWSFPASLEEKQKDRFELIEAMKMIETIDPDVVVIHMFCTKTPSVIAMLELMNIPSIGSMSSTYSTVIDKAVSRGVMQSVNLPIPEGKLVDETSDLDKINLNYPCVVKPTRTENSIGISLVQNKEELVKGVDTALGFGPQVVIEEFIPGREIRVGVIENNNGDIIPLPCLEYVIDHDNVRKFEDKLEYEGEIKMYRNTTTKWVEESEEKELIEKLQQLAIKSHRALQCRDFSLLDCRVTNDGEPYILESNLFCSLSPSSVVNKMVKRMGMTDVQLMDIMVKNTMKRNCL